MEKVNGKSKMCRFELELGCGRPTCTGAITIWSRHVWSLGLLKVAMLSVLLWQLRVSNMLCNLSVAHRGITGKCLIFIRSQVSFIYFRVPACVTFNTNCVPECPAGHCVPPARSGHRCVADSTNLYVFGGYNPDFEEAGGSENEDYPLFRELWRFHFATATWQQVRTEGYMPTELASMSGMDWCSPSYFIRMVQYILHTFTII